MSEPPTPSSKPAPAVTLSSPPSKPNPAFRMLGIPHFRPRLPSRNWLIFLTVTGTFTGTILYDRRQKRLAQQKWCSLVSHLAAEPLPATQLPRKITVFLSAPPGDGLRPAREYFNEYVKPILVAAALDWDVVEGRREGEVRAGLAERIRKLRCGKGEGESSGNSPPLSSEEGDPSDGTDMVADLRRKNGIAEWPGVTGDLIIGRHTWKEYMRGLHEGWLGPLEPPPPPPPPITTTSTSSDSPTDSLSPDSPQSPPEQQPQPPSPSPKPSPPPAYITPSTYPLAPLPPTTPPTFPPVLPLPFPHLLGFLSTPTRIYRFLTRRHQTDLTGRSVAALVLATSTRPFTSDNNSAIDSATPTQSPIASSSFSSSSQWEQSSLLASEEASWHKSVYRAPPAPKAGAGDDEQPPREREWVDSMALDARVCERMRLFVLAAEEEERARALVEEERRMRRQEGVWAGLKGWVGLGGEGGGAKGWEMGLVGEGEGE